MKPFPTRINDWRSPILKKNGNMIGILVESDKPFERLKLVVNQVIKGI